MSAAKKMSAAISSASGVAPSVHQTAAAKKKSVVAVRRVPHKTSPESRDAKCRVSIATLETKLPLGDRSDHKGGNGGNGGADDDIGDNDAASATENDENDIVPVIGDLASAHAPHQKASGPRANDPPTSDHDAASTDVATKRVEMLGASLVARPVSPARDAASASTGVRTIKGSGNGSGSGADDNDASGENESGRAAPKAASKPRPRALPSAPTPPAASSGLAPAAPSTAAPTGGAKSRVGGAKPPARRGRPPGSMNKKKKKDVTAAGVTNVAAAKKPRAAARPKAAPRPRASATPIDATRATPRASNDTLSFAIGSAVAAADLAFGPCVPSDRATECDDDLDDDEGGGGDGGSVRARGSIVQVASSAGRGLENGAATPTTMPSPAAAGMKSKLKPTFSTSAATNGHNVARTSVPTDADDGEEVATATMLQRHPAIASLAPASASAHLSVAPLAAKRFGRVAAAEDARQRHKARAASYPHWRRRRDRQSSYCASSFRRSARPMYGGDTDDRDVYADRSAQRVNLKGRVGGGGGSRGGGRSKCWGRVDRMLRDDQDIFRAIADTMYLLTSSVNTRRHAYARLAQRPSDDEPTDEDDDNDDDDDDDGALNELETASDEDDVSLGAMAPPGPCPLPYRQVSSVSRYATPMPQRRSVSTLSGTPVISASLKRPRRVAVPSATLVAPSTSLGPVSRPVPTHPSLPAPPPPPPPHSSSATSNGSVSRKRKSPAPAKSLSPDIAVRRNTQARKRQAKGATSAPHHLTLLDADEKSVTTAPAAPSLQPASEAPTDSPALPVFATSGVANEVLSHDAPCNLMGALIDPWNDAPFQFPNDYGSLTLDFPILDSLPPANMVAVAPTTTTPDLLLLS